MRFIVLFGLLALPACKPQSAPPASTPAAPAPAETGFQDDPPAPPAKATPVTTLDWPPVPTTRIYLGESVWLETTRPPADAVALTVGNALNTLGASFSAPDLLSAALPKQ